MKAWVLTDENGRVTATAISGSLDRERKWTCRTGTTWNDSRTGDWRTGRWCTTRRSPDNANRGADTDK